MTSRFSKGGKLIDRTKRLSFRFNGKNLFAYGGDTLASALLANNQVLIGRSFKYHRPRGIVSSGIEEPNALVSLGSGGSFEPNRSATTIELFDGVEATSQNHLGSLEWDVGSVNNLISKIFPAGFYYKTFIYPRFAWKHIFEPTIRSAAGLGKAPKEEDSSSYDYFYAHLDVVIIGGGITGLVAAKNLAKSGLKILLVEQKHFLGGYALSEEFKINNSNSFEFIKKLENELSDFENIRVKKNFSIIGIHDHSYLIGSENMEQMERNSQSSIRQRLWRIRAKHVILATGAIERPLVFAGNDIPGVMLCSAALEFYKLYGVSPGDRVVVLTNNDSAYSSVIELFNAGISVPLVIDVREKSDGNLPLKAKKLGIRVEFSKAISKVIGKKKVKAVELCSVVGEGAVLETIICDSVLMSGGWTSTLNLWSHCGGKIKWDSKLNTLVPDESFPSINEFGRSFITVLGSADGKFWPSDLFANIEKKLNILYSELNLKKTKTIRYDIDKSIKGETSSIFCVPEAANENLKAKSFVDYQNDVKLTDLRIAAQEGFESVEHLKRYTTLGMATDQGKLSNINGIKILANLLGKEINEVGTTTFRPPYTPISLGSIAGEARKELFKPIRRTPIHNWHQENGAIFEPVADWQRPYAYIRNNETLEEAINREVKNTRNALGMLDASTLGKIIVSGSDAGEFLDLIYTNMMSSLKPGRCRYGLMCNENGFLFDDGVVVRLDEKTFLCHTTTGGSDRVYSWMEEWHQTEWWDKKVFIQNVTEEYTQITIAGPKARLLLEKLGGLKVDNVNFKPLDFFEGKLGNFEARVFRISFSGELSFEIAVPSKDGIAFWMRCLELGRDLDLTPYGTEALHIMRAEKGFIMIGDETDGTVIPQDLNLEWAISKKKRDFIGKRAHERIFMQDINRKTLVGLSLQNSTKKIPDGAYALKSGGKGAKDVLGHITSSYFSPTLDKPIAMALLKNGKALKGQIVDIPIESGNILKATVVEPQFYDIEGKRQNV